MKVPPKRKGNTSATVHISKIITLNESPSEKEGKFALSKSGVYSESLPSMKVPPKRKGNCPLSRKCQRTQ